MRSEFRGARGLRWSGGRSWVRQGGLFVAGAALAMSAFGCAEIVPANPEAAARLADRRTELEEDNVLIEYQKKRKTEAVQNRENPDRYDDAEILRAEERFQRIWKGQRKIEFDKFYARYAKLSGDVVSKCNIIANKDSVKAWEIDGCVETVPEARYDPLRTAGVTLAVILLAIAGMGLYRQGRRSIDPVAQAAGKLGMKANQGRRSTELTGNYKGYNVRVEAAAPEVGGGDKYVRVHVLDKIQSSVVVRFGPIAPPTGLEMPDLDAPEVEDARIPMGYKLRLSTGASAEELLGGDVGFQIREFDPVDVRVHDGGLAVTTWFILSDPEQVVELVDLCLAVAELYKA